jgi:hypothetical protein
MGAEKRVSGSVTNADGVDPVEAPSYADLVAGLKKAEFAMSFATPRGVQGVHENYPRVLTEVRELLALADGVAATSKASDETRNGGSDG